MTPTETTLRAATAADIPAIARLWHVGWHEAHAPIVPPALTAARTFADISGRTARHIARADVATAGPQGPILGFVMIRDSELFQLYTSPGARGSGGVARALLAHGEDRLARAGVTRAHLACAIGNDRAARFYERAGWQRAGTVEEQLESLAGSFLLHIWRFEKPLRQPR